MFNTFVVFYHIEYYDRLYAQSRIIDIILIKFLKLKTPV